MATNKYYIKRYFAFFIDWNMTFFVGIPLFFCGPQFDPEYLLMPSVKMFSAFGTILAVMVLVLFPLLKDAIFGGASIGKRILGLKVVDSKTGVKPRIGNLIIRNLLFYIPMINGIVMLVTQGTSVGDMIAATKVVEK